MTGRWCAIERFEGDDHPATGLVRVTVVGVGTLTVPACAEHRQAAHVLGTARALEPASTGGSADV